MAHKQQQKLHQLLNQDQEPFHLKTHLAHKRSQFNQTSTTNNLQLKKRTTITPQTTLKRGTILCKHACFLSFNNSPFPDFRSPSPILSPCKSPNGAVYLHVPSKTAALLAEAATRIQKQHPTKSKTQGKNPGFGLFGSFLKRLKDRSIKNNKRVVRDNGNVKNSLEEKNAGVSNEVKLDMDLDQASTSSCCCECSHEEINCDFDLWETRFCSSPFRFSLQQSPESTARRTPEFCSPVASPSRLINQEKQNFETQDSDKVQGEEEDEKEQSSPVSVLDPPFEDDGHESSGDAEEDDHDLECSYANMQRAKQQLLYRLRRFEKLAELDPVELERKLLEGSDSEDQGDIEDSDNEKPLSLYRDHNVDTLISQVFNQSSHSRKMSSMKRLVSDLKVKEKNKIVFLCNKEVMMGKFFNKLDLSKDIKFSTIDIMMELDLKRESHEWKKFQEQREEIVAEVESAIFELLVEELSEDLYNMDVQYHKLNLVDVGCS